MTNSINMQSLNNFQNYNNQQGSYNCNAYSKVPRGWLIIAQIFGAIFSVIGLMLYLHFMQNIYDSLPSGDLAKKSLLALILAIIVYFVWRSIYIAAIIISFINKSTDYEICSNRYIISSLSLSAGGLFTPFLITKFSNVPTTSTIKPRYFLSKTMGLCVLIGAPIFALTYFLTLLVGTNAVSNVKLIFDTASRMGVISIVISTLAFITFIFGIITTSLFFSNKTHNEFNNNTPSPILKTISNIWMAILTFELIIIMLLSILRLIAAIADLFRSGEKNSGPIMLVFALLNLLYTLSYTGMVIYITQKTIFGLWSIDGNVKIGQYRHINVAQNRFYSNGMLG